MIKKYRFIWGILVIVLSISISVISSINRTQLQYIMEKSYFHNFEISGGNIYIRCDIQIKNNSEHTLKFYMIEDVRREKIVAEDEIYAYNVDDLDRRQLFIIAPYTAKLYQNVLFKGTSTGEEVKEDRLPPENIKFEVID